jgi:hypothetical protein
MAEIPDDALEGLRWVDLLVIAGVSARPGVTAGELARWPRYPRWQIRRAFRRLEADGIVEPQDDGYRATAYGRKLAPVALSALALRGFEPD